MEDRARTWRTVIYNGNVFLNFQFYLVMKGQGKGLEESDM
jgi:hypothetical protein